MSTHKTREDLLDALVKAARESVASYPRTHAFTQREDNALAAALEAWDAGPQVPAHHCPECGEHGVTEDNVIDGGFYFTCDTSGCPNHNCECETCGECPDCPRPGEAARPCAAQGCRRGEGAPPYDAATATGMYDHD